MSQAHRFFKLCQGLAIVAFLLCCVPWGRGATTNELVYLGQWPPGPHGSRTAVQASGNYVYASIDSGGFCVFDVADPKYPTTIGRVQTTGSSWGLALSGTTVYLADGDAGVKIYDVTNPAAAKRLDLGNSLGTAGHFQVVDGKIFGQPNAGAGPGLQVLEIADPAHPVRRRTMLSDAFVGHFEIQGTTLYAICDSRFLRVYAIQDLSAPTLLGTFDAGMPLRKVHVNGGMACLLGTNTTIRIVSVNHPDGITFLGSAYFDWPSTDFQ